MGLLNNFSFFEHVFPIVFILIFVVCIGLFIFSLAAIFSPSLRGKMLANQFKAFKFLFKDIKDDAKEMSKDFAETKRDIYRENKDAYKDVADMKSDIYHDTIKSAASAIKEGLGSDSYNPKQIYCKYCGQPIDADSQYCKHCGRQQ